MYRIVLDPKTAKWNVQISKLMLIWRTVKAGPFETFDEAVTFVANSGIPKVYRNYHERPPLFGGEPCER